MHIVNLVQVGALELCLSSILYRLHVCKRCVNKGQSSHSHRMSARSASAQAVRPLRDRAALGRDEERKRAKWRA